MRPIKIVAAAVLVLGFGAIHAGSIGLNSLSYPAGKEIEVPFVATDRASTGASATAVVKPEGQQTSITIEYSKLSPAVLFGGDIVAYVTWTVSPDGTVENLGQIAAVKEKGTELYTTRKRDFALMVTAEPIATVSQPSELVVLLSGAPKEKDVRPVPITHSGLQEREGMVTRERDSIAGLKYKDKTPLMLVQAQKAVQLAERFEGPKYNPDAYKKAQDALAQATEMKGKGKEAEAASRNAIQSADAAIREAFKKKEQEAAAAQAAADAAAREAQAKAKDAEAAALGARAQSSETQLAETQAALDRANAEVARLKSEQTSMQSTRVTLEADRAKLQKQRDALSGKLTGALGGIAVASKSEKGYTVSLAGTAFPSGKSTLTTDAKYVLAKLSGVLLAFPDMKLDVEGHTDSTGAAEANQKLSLARAEAVMTFLKEMGVPAATMTAHGFGPDRPVAPNDTPEGRSKNRRVDIVMTE
jgi:outer membrane protein OmpA-like peptidoglycan-associated protein